MNKKSYFLVGLTCIIAGSLILFGCGKNEKSPVESEVEATGVLNIAISNAPINATAAKAYVYATDMNDTITASLTLNDTMVTGTISGIPVGSGGKPCIRGLRVTVGTIVGLVASGYSTVDILKAYPYLEKEDISEAFAYAAWRAEEIEVPLP